MTERLYYTDSHLTEFEARVVAVAPLEGSRAAVKLERTAFYPTGGGQPSDTGTLGAARVVECVDEEDAGVVHVVEGDVPPVGALVRGHVDWERRLDHLQQHTGQHILSQAFVQLFGAQTRSFRMLERASEIDLALDDPSDERIEQAVSLANRIIWEDRPVSIHQATPEEAAAMPLRKDSARAGMLRVIEIEGFDVSPCGGTHAQRTGEVGVVAVRSWERAKGLTRIEFLAGGRVHADYRRANATARSVASLFSVARDEAVASVTRLLEENKQLMRRVRPLEELAVRVEAEELWSEAARNVGDGARSVEGDKKSEDEGVVVVVRTFEGRDADSLRRLAAAVASHASNSAALLASREGEDVRLVFARSADAAGTGDMSALMREACAAIGGRGGGRPDMAQGGGRASVEQIHTILETAALRLKKGY